METVDDGAAESRRRVVAVDEAHGKVRGIRRLPNEIGGVVGRIVDEEDLERAAAQGCADAVIEALGLREERRPGITATLNDSVWTQPDKRRYITEWEATP